MTWTRKWGVVALAAALGAGLGLGACAGGDDAVQAASGDDGSDASIDASSRVGEVDSSSPDTSTPSQPHDAAPDTATHDAGTNLAPVPTLTSIAPSQAIVGSAGPTIVCTGAGFVARSVVQVDGIVLATSFVSDTELRATMPDQKLAQVGTVHVTVGTAPPGGGGSAEVDFAVVNPSPVVTSLSPTSVLMGANATPLTVKGSLFVDGATIAFAGATLATKVVDPQTLTATIPAASLAASGTFPVVVTNPAPGGGASSSIAFVVANPTVTLSNVTPSTITYGSPDTPIALVGSGFVAASAVSFNGATIASSFTDATHLSATVPASALLAVGDFPVAVTNPAPGGGVSTPVTVHVVYPSPTATSIMPTSIVLGASPPTIQVTGSGFIAGVTTIAFDGAAAQTNVTDATHASATLTTQQVASAHVIQVTVSNPAPGGGTSAPIAFTIENPAPVATSLSPSSAIVGAGDTPITVSGSSFESNSTVLLGGSPLATTYQSATSLAATIPAAQLASATTLSIAVQTPAPGGGTSPSLPFVVDNPGPTIASVTPPSTTVPATDTPITISGSGFVANVSVVQINGSAAATSYAQGSLGATIPASLLGSAGTVAITVANPAPGGGTSNVAYFTANDPAPVLGSVSPNALTYGAGATSIAVVGSGFVAASVVRANGGTLTSTFQDASHLSATLPTSIIDAGGNVTITVSNPAPGGGTSAGQTITVSCDTTGADVVLSSLNAVTTLTPNIASSSTTAYRIVQSLGNYSCPATDDTSAKEPYVAYVVANGMTQAATLSAWAVCTTSSQDSFLAFYSTATKPTTQSQLAQCVKTVSEGNASGYDSKSDGGSSYCPGLTKTNGGGLSMGACGRAVMVVQAYDASTSSSYPPPATLKVDLE